MSTSEYGVFKELAQIFTNSQRKNEILEIEILQPGLTFGLSPLLQDGRFIGISKVALVQAFAVARRIFFDKLVSMSDSEILSAISSEEAHRDAGVAISDEEVDFLVSVVTAIILLFDCEHLTACNWRKRRLECLIQTAGSTKMDNAERESIVRTLEAELTLMETFISSPLQRHTKSPTLWQHRLWVLTRLIRLAEPTTLHPVQQEKEKEKGEGKNAVRLDAFQELLKSELAIVLRAGEQHPRNYYAFTYMRRLHSVLSDAMEGPGDYSVKLARSILDGALDWCCCHPRDISGWMFVLYLLEAIPEQGIRTDSITRVVRFALNVGWEGESLWTFVDLCTRRFGSVEIIQDTLRSQGTKTIGFAAEDRVVDGINLSERPWKVWVARARAYWTETNAGITRRES